MGRRTASGHSEGTSVDAAFSLDSRDPMAAFDDSSESSDTTESDHEDEEHTPVGGVEVIPTVYPSLPGSLKFPSAAGKPNRLVLVMVGLPARGKTFISRKICRYVTWLGHNCRVFNVGQYRRVQDEATGGYQGAAFFNADNHTAQQERNNAAVSALEHMISWLLEDGQVAIFDATNSTVERRQWVINECHSRQFQVLFVESICNDPSIIEENVQKHKIKSPDYVNMEPEEAVTDFKKRISHYEAAYEPLGEAEDLSFCKIIDAGRQVIINNIRGFLPARIVSFLMNIHTHQRDIYLSRHGQSEYNVTGQVGGDTGLTEVGRRYAVCLGAFTEKEFDKNKPLSVWTSTLQRTQQTASKIKRSKHKFRVLDEIDAGECDGWTYKEIEEKMPALHENRKQDKLRCRYPRGESYLDLISRLEPIFVEIERQQVPILIVAHQAILRVIIAYLTDQKPSDCPHMKVPTHTVVKLTPHPYGCDVVNYPLLEDPSGGCGVQHHSS